MSNSWSTIKRARTLGLRHPDAPASVKAIAMHLASYAEGSTGTRIYPGVARLVEESGFAKSTVDLAIKWLRDHGEIRQDKAGRRGSAACFTYLGLHLAPDRSVAGSTPAPDLRDHSARPATTHQPIEALTGSGLKSSPPSVVQAGIANPGCPLHPEAINECPECRALYGLESNLEGE